MPDESMSTLTGRAVHCILFDLGYTLWDRRRNEELWCQAERAANQRAVALLRQHIAPELLPSGDDEALGVRLREAFDEREHFMIRRHPGLEPNGTLAVIQALQQRGVGDVDLALAAAVFQALNVRIPDSLPLLE